MKSALIVLGDQLFPTKFYAPYVDSAVFMAEDHQLATHFKYHKHKIAFFFLSMRSYADELRKLKFNVVYEKLSKTSFLERLDVFIRKNKISKIVMAEIQDKFFEKELLNYFKMNNLDCQILPSPMFLCSRAEFAGYLKKHPRPFMKTFYEKERLRLKILLDNNDEPLGGQWSFDVENRNKAPKNLSNTSFLAFEKSSYHENVIELIEEKFSDHPGSLNDFWLPTTRKDSLKVLKHFLENHLELFGQYQDAITARDPFLYHSIISPMLNNGMITPAEVIDEVTKIFQKNKNIPLNSVEGFVRQILGWREFVRGIYQNFSDKQDQLNFFKHQRKFKACWYEGTTGILPLDDAIKKANKLGYCHHIERLMVLSNIMLLCEIDPRVVHRWFMEMFVDSADWVMGPNVFGMGQFSDGGIFATKPYISGSNYILKMSDYKKDASWCEVWDGLYWRFIDKHANFFSKNHRLNMMVKFSQKMDKKKKKYHIELAENFLLECTII